MSALTANTFINRCTISIDGSKCPNGGDIRAYEPNWWGRQKEGNILQNIFYDTANGFYIFGQHLTLVPTNERMNLDRTGASFDDQVLGVSGAGMSLVGGSSIKTFGNIIKGTEKGGLNLFKWGAKQTNKSAGWRTGDYMLNLPNRGTPKLNWKANYGALRREMSFGKPIYDSYSLPNGNLIPTGGFLNAERFILLSRGWIYNPKRGAWLPPNNSF